MALTAQEEALVRQLLDQQAAILSLAGNEATITSKLGATKVTLADLVAASSLADADLLLTRQGTTDKSVRADILAAYMGAELGALFAPIANPTFTGDPKAPTPAQFDNDTSLATTAFVQRALGNMQASRTVAAGSTSLALGDVGKTVSVTGTSAATITLPQGAGIPDGSKLEFFVSNTSSVTILPYGADTIFVNSGLVPNFLLYAGDSLTLEWIGITWIAVAGSAQLRYSTGRFGSSLTAAGYQKLPSGLIIQWGSATTNAAGAVTVSYPIAFPNAVVSLVASGTNSNVVTTAFINVNPISLSQAAFYAANTSIGISYGIKYIAIGY